VPARLDTLAAAGHLGLVGLQRRVGHAGGGLSLMAAPGRGTVVRVAIPIETARGMIVVDK
jgi:signal transduction histidine kinase